MKTTLDDHDDIGLNDAELTALAITARADRYRTLQAALADAVVDAETAALAVRALWRRVEGLMQGESACPALEELAGQLAEASVAAGEWHKLGVPPANWLTSLRPSGAAFGFSHSAAPSGFLEVGG